MSGEPTPGGSRLPPLSLGHLWALATLGIIFIFLSTHPIRPHDFWWHLRAGQQILTSGQIPSIDTYSFTMAGQPYTNYASYWSMEVAYSLLYSWGRTALVIFAHSLVITGAYAVLLWLCWRVSHGWRIAAAATFFAALLGFNDWNVRPQAIAFLIGTIYLWTIYAYRWRSRWWLLLVFPLGMLIWANSHGSWIIGLILLAIWLVDETWQALQGVRHSQTRKAFKSTSGPALGLALTLLATLANPRGPSIFTYVQALSGNPVVRHLVTEWAPPSFATLGGILFFLGFFVAILVLLVSPKRPTLFQVLTLAIFGILGFRTMRGSVWFGLVMAPTMADHLAAVTRQWLLNSSRPYDFPQRTVNPRGASTITSTGGSPSRPLLLFNYLLAGLLLVGAVFSLPWLKHLLPLPAVRAGLLSVETPVEATRVLLEERLPGRLFNELGFGSYLIWAAQSNYPVFIDPRIELYPVELWQDYLEISAAGDAWDRRLEQYGIKTLIVSPQRQPALVEAARRAPQWRLVYEDPHAVLFVRLSAISI